MKAPLVRWERNRCTLKGVSALPIKSPLRGEPQELRAPVFTAEFLRLASEVLVSFQGDPEYCEGKSMARILVVEDDDKIRSLVSVALGANGHEVQSAASADQALALFSRFGVFDLVISDVIMPGMDGHEFARQMAIFYPTTRVMLMSGYDSGCQICPYVQKCPFLAKPFTVETLLNAVNRCLLLAPPQQLPPTANS